MEDCRPDLTWSGLCLAQLNHHMSEFVTKFLDQQIKYKVRFKIISLSAQRTESFHPHRVRLFYQTPTYTSLE